MGKISNPQILKGKYVTLRDAEITDAAFILSLRTDEKKARYLHKTENNVEKQVEYLKRYKTLDNEWYFIFENKKGVPLGTIRIYDVNGTTFTHGSWLAVSNATPQEAIEGEMLCKNYAFEELGMKVLHFEVRKENTKVVNYHKTWGSKIVSENDLDYFFELSKEDFLKNKEKFKRWL